ncbi:MAG: hypothetical protein R3B91_11815 [Planctomycetaceae bacterium]
MNTALRDRELIPTQVELKLSLNGESNLRAEHTFEPKLMPFDRDSINKWEKLGRLTMSAGSTFVNTSESS